MLKSFACPPKYFARTLMILRATVQDGVQALTLKINTLIIELLIAKFLYCSHIYRTENVIQTMHTIVNNY